MAALALRRSRSSHPLSLPNIPKPYLGMLSGRSEAPQFDAPSDTTDEGFFVVQALPMFEKKLNKYCSIMT